jgi:hypothetical protein
MFKLWLIVLICPNLNAFYIPFHTNSFQRRQQVTLLSRSQFSGTTNKIRDCALRNKQELMQILNSPSMLTRTGRHRVVRECVLSGMILCAL